MPKHRARWEPKSDQWYDEFGYPCGSNQHVLLTKIAFKCVIMHEQRFAMWQKRLQVQCSSIPMITFTFLLNDSFEFEQDDSLVRLSRIAFLSTSFTHILLGCCSV